MLCTSIEPRSGSMLTQVALPCVFSFSPNESCQVNYNLNNDEQIRELVELGVILDLGQIHNVDYY